jgi:hypothetical protein
MSETTALQNIPIFFIVNHGVKITMQKNRLLSIFALIVFSITPSIASANCNLLYGDYWAFVFSTPANWSSLCRAEKKYGMALAIWPTGSSFEQAPAVMYVSVNQKEGKSLTEFNKWSLETFRKAKPQIVFKPLTFEAKSKLNAMHFSATGGPEGNFDRIAYIEGPSAYFMMILSAQSAEALDSALPAYRELFESFSPMSNTIKK